MRQTIASALFLFLLGSEEQREKPAGPQTDFCVGYTKIAYGMAVDCRGDTIKIKEFNEYYKEYLKTRKPN
jgi:hypothetical protein